MSPSLRLFSVVSSALILLSASAHALPQGVAAGDTTQTSSVLWARAAQAGSVLFEVSTDPAFSAIAVSQSVTVVDPTLPAKVELTGLTSGTEYFYRATDSSGAHADGHFSTSHALGEYAGLRFGVSGDWRGELAPYPGVANAPARQLDFFVALGDTIYADYPSPALPTPQALSLSEFRTKHAEVYSERGGANTLGALRASTTTYATIDDHEVTNDFQGGALVSSDPRFGPPASPTQRINDATLYDTGLQVFHEYNPIKAETYGATGDDRTAGELKLYRNRTFGSDASLHVLDARSFRDPGLPNVTNLSDPAQVGNFLASSFAPGRTFLGEEQLSDLKDDLRAAQAAGITWKFVTLPEPIQNLGVLGASDRYEGYAAERADLLRYIATQGIQNVVFIAADIHGTLVNNLTYQNGPFQPQIPLGIFEITTGAVAFDAPFGPTVAELARAAGLITSAQYAFYLSLPTAPDFDSVPNDKDDFLKSVINSTLTPLGYDPLGLTQNPSGSNLINARLLQGDYESLHTYGWTEFDINPLSQLLTVTTYGVPWYTDDLALADPAALMSRVPQVVSQFEVTPAGFAPVPEPSTYGVGAAVLLALIALRGRRAKRKA